MLAYMLLTSCPPGCAAARALRPGDKALSIPESVLIYEDTVRQTDLVRGDGRGLGERGERGEACV